MLSLELMLTADGVEETINNAIELKKLGVEFLATHES
jgi:hypothetical protein